jgi:hypothetical protein
MFLSKIIAKHRVRSATFVAFAVVYTFGTFGLLWHFEVPNALNAIADCLHGQGIPFAKMDIASWSVLEVVLTGAACIGAPYLDYKAYAYWKRVAKLAKRKKRIRARLKTWR